jgi:hypothetical protein
MSKLDNLLKEEKLNRFEGEKGVQNLAILCRCLGYKDDRYFGQFSHRASYGDLINFLEDNPGAVEAILNFIQDNENSYEALEDYEDEEA